MAPRHDASCAKLPTDQAHALRKIIAARGWARTATQLGSTETTIHKLLEGPGLTKASRDRIAAKLAHLLEVDPPVVIDKLTLPAKEETFSVATGRVVMVHVAGDAEAVAQVLPAALEMAKGFFGR